MPFGWLDTHARDVAPPPRRAAKQDDRDYRDPRIATGAVEVWPLGETDRRARLSPDGYRER
jgi:hypothetical protein